MAPELDPDDALAALSAKEDQSLARRRAFAFAVGAYYAALTESGIPEGLASSLTENFHDHHWAFVFGANSTDA